MKSDNNTCDRRNLFEIFVTLALTALFLGGCGGGGGGGGGSDSVGEVVSAAPGTLKLAAPPAQNSAGTNLPASSPPTGQAPMPPSAAVVVASVVIPQLVRPPPAVQPPPIVAPALVAIPKIITPAPVVTRPAVATPFSGYVVKGNTIYDKSTGQSHLFRGVASPSMDWGVYCENCSPDQFLIMRRDWHVNVVRLSVNPFFWLKSSPQYSPAYASEIARVVAAVEKEGMDVILDNHRTSTQYMVGAEGIAFWNEVASVYRNDPHVLFELFNEPHDISWDLWLNGGTAPDGKQVHGMQEMYNTVRATGATNLVVVGGPNWAYELADIPLHRVVGNNIVYATHPYDFPGKQPSDWDRAFGNLAKTDPIIATEFGNYTCTPGYYQAFVDYARAHNISWTAWAWYQGGCGFPGLLSDSLGTPNVAGAVVKAALLN